MIRENQIFTCSNLACKRDFANPLSVQNLRSENRAQYLGCPYCLTEIKDNSEIGKERRELVAHRKKAEPIEIKLIQGSSSQKCPHHFGYLNQRPRAERIPEECMICEKLVECMLKNQS
jgi:hypothetical protein